MKNHTSFDGTNIAYLDEGEGPIVLLLHGYGSSVHGNWVEPGLVAALKSAGYRVLAPDLRGHGKSDKPHEISAYQDLALVKDVAGLLDHLGVEAAQVVGYSMGSTIAAWLALTDTRVTRLVIGGHGDTITMEKWEGADHAAAGLLAAETDALDDVQLAYRAFITQEGGDFVAMARVAQTDEGVPQDRLKDLTLPTLILTGSEDTMVGPVEGLATALPNAEIARPPGDHLTTVTTPEFRDALLAFLVSQ